MQRRSANQTLSLLVRALLAVLFTYSVVGGTTSNAMLNIPYKVVTGLLVGIGAVAWLYLRGRQRWKWHHTPLDGVLLIWLAAFAISLIANLDAWRRIAIGLWYVGAYIGAWYILQDVLSNRGLRRETLSELFLIAGIAVLIFGYVGWINAALNWLRLPAEARISFSNIVRATSTLDNPNMLATFMVMLTPIAASYTLRARNRALAVSFAVYTVLSGVLGFLSFSRAGWVGLGVMAAAFVTLLAAHYGMFSSERRRTLSLQLRRLFLVAGAAVVIGGVIGVVLLLRVSGQAGRQTDLRTYMYQAGLQMFAEKPLTGYGLFTFGRDLGRLSSIPPLISHAHSHNIPINIAAELGFPGLLAALGTIYSIGRAYWRNWRALAGRDRLLLIGSGAALVGFAGQGAFDNTATMATIALTALLMVVIASAPPAPVPVSPNRRRAQTWAIVGLGAALLLTGIWSNIAYQSYINGLKALTNRKYREAVQMIQSAIDTDPMIPVYHMYKGLLLSWLAEEGDRDAMGQAIAAYRRVTEIDPYYSLGWADLGALYRANGDLDNALQAMGHAADLAPDDFVLPMNLGFLEEEAGKADAAMATYTHILARYPGTVLYSRWAETGLRRSLRDAPDIVGRLTPREQVAYYVAKGDFAAANRLWDARDSATPIPVEHQRLIEIILKAQRGDDAQQALAALNAAVARPAENVSVHLARAYLAWFSGDQETARKERDTTQQLVDGIVIHDYFDYAVGPFTYSQYLRASGPPYLVNEIYAPRIDSFIASLIDTLDGLVK